MHYFTILISLFLMYNVKADSLQNDNCDINDSVCRENSDLKNTTPLSMSSTDNGEKITDVSLDKEYMIYNESEDFNSNLINKNENDTKLSGQNLDSTTEITTLSNIFKESSTNKPNTTITTTTQNPGIYYPTFNKTVQQTICVCDLTINQCDINCCCDEDCSYVHFKMFTRCNDFVYTDSKYCFKTNIIFKNNTKYKIVENQGGLFCIAKDNSPDFSSFETKPVITSLEDFDKSLTTKKYSFSFKSSKKFKFKVKEYKAGLPVWVFQNGEIHDFEIPAPSIGYLCTYQIKLKYIHNQQTKCSYKLPQNEFECGTSKLKNIFDYLRSLKIVVNPFSINTTIPLPKQCQASKCLSVISYICNSTSTNSCTKIPENPNQQIKIGCWNTIPKIQYLITHNGTEGIKKFEAYIWLGNVSRATDDFFLQTTEVKYSWSGFPNKVFKRSGNPGYLPGKPILAGKKIYHLVNKTNEKKEAIQLSFDPKDWLTILGSEKGICSSNKRIPISFKENSINFCLFPIVKSMFGKEKCKELQLSIFEYVIGSDIVNASNDNFFNKFVGTFGNSKVEELNHWVQVLIDLFPISSSQVGFKPNYNKLICKNVITDLNIQIAYGSFGSFSAPQSKILGVLFSFGKHKDVIFNCNAYNCENSTSVEYARLSTSVSFFDGTEVAEDAFAQPLGLEAKLPHDFFYPFFSKSYNLHSSKIIVLFSVFLLFV